MNFQIYLQIWHTTPLLYSVCYRLINFTEMEQPKQLETADLQKLREICQDYINFIDNDEEYHEYNDYDH